MKNTNVKNSRLPGAANTGILILALFTGNFGWANHNLECAPYQNRIDVLQREVAQFDRLVLDPMRRQRLKLENQMEYKIQEPTRLRNANRQLQSDVRQLEKNKALLPGQIADLEARASLRQEEAEKLEAEAETLSGMARQLKLAKAKEARQRARELTKAAAQKSAQLENIDNVILRKLERITSNEATATEIETSVPTVAELREGIRAFNEKLADEARIRAEKVSDLRFAESTLSICNERVFLSDAYQSLQNSILAIKNGGCQVVLPLPRSEGEGRGQSDARRLLCL